MKNVYLILGAGSEVAMTYIERILADEKDKIIIACYRNTSERLEQIFADADVIPVRADLSDDSQVRKIIEYADGEGLLPTHILHTASGPYEFIRTKNWDLDKASEHMQISLYSFARICSAYLPRMAKAGRGNVVAVLSSVVLGTPPACTGMYTAAKYALMGYVRSLAAEYADKGLNINSVSPGMMKTGFLDSIDERIVEMNTTGCRRKRLITVQETVDAIEFLMSDKASYINGENINLSGGDYM